MKRLVQAERLEKQAVASLRICSVGPRRAHLELPVGSEIRPMRDQSRPLCAELRELTFQRGNLLLRLTQRELVSSLDADCLVYCCLVEAA